MKQVIVLEKHDLARLKDGDTIQLTPTLLLSVERGLRKATSEITPPTSPTARTLGERHRKRKAHRLVADGKGLFHCAFCDHKTSSIPQMRGHLGAHAKAGHTRRTE